MTIPENYCEHDGPEGHFLRERSGCWSYPGESHQNEAWEASGDHFNPGSLSRWPGNDSDNFRLGHVEPDASADDVLAFARGRLSRLYGKSVESTGTVSVNRKTGAVVRGCPRLGRDAYYHYPDDPRELDPDYECVNPEEARIERDQDKAEREANRLWLHELSERMKAEASE